MDSKTAALAYRTASIENAPPVKIVRLLYEGALRYLDRATLEATSGTPTGYTANLARADAIVTELRLAIDASHGEEIASELERLYLFVEDQIGIAMYERSVEAVEHARTVLSKLLEAWVQLDLAEAGEGLA